MDIRMVPITSRAQVEDLVRSTGADPYAIPRMAEKAVMNSIVVQRIDTRAANIIKQEMLALGGDAAVSRGVSLFRRGFTAVAIFGTSRQVRLLCGKLADQPFGLKQFSAQLTAAVARFETADFVVAARQKKIRLGRQPVVMGIVNVTPDSFSDGGTLANAAAAVARASAMVDAGAGIIDVGGESSRPGARPVSAAAEAARVVPVIRLLAKRLPVPISIDTCKPAVAAAALRAGAHLINDITGLRHQRAAMIAIARRYQAAVIIMHMQGRPRIMQQAPRYGDVVGEVADFLAERAAAAIAGGVSPDRIILDPGFGFGKTLEHNISLLARLREFSVLGYPLAVGISRKSFIGGLTGEAAPDRRLAGSLAAAVCAAAAGAHIIRVHDVRETVQALRVEAAVRGVTWN